MAFPAGVQIALVGVNTHRWVIWHSDTPPVTLERFLLLPTAFGENAQGGFVAEVRIRGFSLLQAVADSFLLSFTRRYLEEALCKTAPSLVVWMLNGEKGAFVPVLPCQGESTRDLLSCSWDHCFACQWVLQTNSTGTFIYMLNTMAVVSCNELCAVDISDKGS